MFQVAQVHRLAKLFCAHMPRYLGGLTDYTQNARGMKGLSVVFLEIYIKCLGMHLTEKLIHIC
jgi:hypothetical protein